MSKKIVIMGADRRRLMVGIAGLMVITVGMLLLFGLPNGDMEDDNNQDTSSPQSSSGSSSGSNSAPSPGSSGGAEVRGTLISIEFDKTNYNAGDVVKANLKFKNTGEVAITSEEVVIRAYCERLDSLLGRAALKTLSDEERSMTIPLRYNVNVTPGDTGTLGASFQTEAEMEGVSLAGDYTVTVTLKGNGVTLGSKTLGLRLN